MTKKAMIPMLHIQQLPALSDNYIYLLRCDQTGTTAVVDPAEAAPVAEALGDEHLDFILNTHHHADHIGGNLALKKTYDCTIIGAKVDANRIPGIDIEVSEGDTVTIGASMGHVLFIPGHTNGHIAYYFADDKALFCGDTLFAGGCGRLFEGTPAQMFESLKKLAALPDDTRVFCGHEYTQNNLSFALSLKPTDITLQKRAQDVSQKRANHLPTVPSLLGEEKQTNPFIRAKTAEELATLRRQKDNF